MRRSLLLLVLFGLAGAMLVGVSSTLARRVCVRALAPPGDDLAWLRREFRLSPAEFARVRQLHEGYLPGCRELCEQIAARKQQLQATLAAGDGVSIAAEERLRQVGALRAECQARMLRHFHEVSRAMPPDQGRRYLAEMQRLTLGSHEEFEASMSVPAGGAHGHH